MPACNRVTPYGSIEAIDLRGAFTGNRGILHSGPTIVRFHAHDSWVTCSLTFRGRFNVQWRPRHFTWLYFYDEAVSFAAGHRPCGECRRTSYVLYRAAWTEASGGQAPSATQMNRQLHGERIVRGSHRRLTHRAGWSGLPDGAFVDLEGSPWVVVGAHLAQWTSQGYRTRRVRPTHGAATVITPPSTVGAFRAGYPVHIHPSALAPGGPDA